MSELSMQKPLTDEQIHNMLRGEKEDGGIVMKTNTYNFVSFLERFNNDVEEMEIFKVLKELPEIKKGEVWLAGGAIRRTLINELLTTDLDFFFKNEEVLKEFRKELTSRGGEKLSETEHQETYTFMIKNKQYLIQLIMIDFYENVESLLDSFDFTITQFAYDGEDLICGEFSLWDLSRRRLALHKMTYGVATMRRLIKYTSQEYTACAGVMQSILESVVNNPSVINSDIQYID